MEVAYICGEPYKSYKVNLAFILPLSLTLQPKIKLKSSFSRLCIFFFALHVIAVFSFVLDPLLVLIEYVPYGDLLGYLRKSRGLNDTYFNNPDRKPETNLTSKQLMKFAWQIADGMAYLSSRKVNVYNNCNSITEIVFSK